MAALSIRDPLTPPPLPPKKRSIGGSLSPMGGWSISPFSPGWGNPPGLPDLVPNQPWLNESFDSVMHINSLAMHGMFEQQVMQYAILISIRRLDLTMLFDYRARNRDGKRPKSVAEMSQWQPVRLASFLLRRLLPSLLTTLITNRPHQVSSVPLPTPPLCPPKCQPARIIWFHLPYRQPCRPNVANGPIGCRPNTTMSIRPTVAFHLALR